MMLSPAMQPEAMGIVSVLFHLGAFFSSIHTIDAVEPFAVPLFDGLEILRRVVSHRRCSIWVQLPPGGARLGVIHA